MGERAGDRGRECGARDDGGVGGAALAGGDAVCWSSSSSTGERNVGHGYGSRPPSMIVEGFTTRSAEMDEFSLLRGFLLTLRDERVIW